MASGRARAGSSEVRQVAALPWRVINGEVQILMITSRETRRWVIPKGGRMIGKTDPEAAAQEALEEAGVIGPVATTPVGRFRYDKILKSGLSSGRVVSVFPMEVLLQLGDWEEAAERERRWMSIEEAARAVHEPELAILLSSFRPTVSAVDPTPTA